MLRDLGHISEFVAFVWRAHARTGDAAAISGYLGSGAVFDMAIRKFAVAYADQTVRDHQALVDAVDSGRIVAEVDV